MFQGENKWREIELLQMMPSELGLRRIINSKRHFRRIQIRAHRGFASLLHFEKDQQCTSCLCESGDIKSSTANGPEHRGWKAPLTYTDSCSTDSYERLFIYPTTGQKPHVLA